MFETINPAPPDAILGLTEAFQKDPDPRKINLGVGVFKDGSGQTPVLASVKEAERRLLQAEATKSYLPIDGLAAYAAACQQLVFGSDHAIVSDGRAVTVQTPGGTGALRVAADFVRRIFPPGDGLAQRSDLAKSSECLRLRGLACGLLSLL